MVNEKSFLLGNTGSAIRELFEYGKKRKAIIGDDNVFDYSIGNPSIPSPKIVNETLIKLLEEKEPTSLHGYTSGVGDLNVRKAIQDYVNKTYGVNEKAELIYMTCGAAASLTITMNAIINPGDEIFLYTDGVTEAQTKNEKLFGPERLQKVLNQQKLSLPATISLVRKNILRFVKNAPQSDDITMMILEFHK